MTLEVDSVAFGRAWQKAKSVAHVAAKFGISELQARSKAAYLRRCGFPLKKLRSRMTDADRSALRKALRDG